MSIDLSQFLVLIFVGNVLFQIFKKTLGNKIILIKDLARFDTIIRGGKR